MENVYFYLAILFVITVVVVLISQLISVFLRIKYRYQLKHRYGFKPKSPGLLHYSLWSKIRHKPLGFFRLVLVSIIVSVFTIYIFLNTYVLLTHNPLPFITTVSAFPAADSLNALLQGKTIDSVGANYDALGRNRTFNVLKIPRLNLRLDLLPLIRDSKGDIVNRLNSGHYVFTSDTPSSKANNLIVYLTRNWRSLLYPNDILVGDNIFLQKDDGSDAMFKVTEKQILAENQKYVPASTSSLGLVLLIADPQNHTSYYFRGYYVDINSLPPT